MEIAIFNYFEGNEPDNWKRNIPTYSKVIYENIYKNIDLVFTGLIGNKIEFQFIVKPRADVKDITYEIKCFKCRIINKTDVIIVDQEGRVVLSISNLKAYQGVDEIKISFKNKNYLIHYEVEKYNENEVLIIDPDLNSLIASTYFGSSDADEGRSIYLDNNWNVYITGSTNSSNFPTTPNAYDNTFNGIYDGFISKLNNSLDTLLASTFLGGSSIDFPNYTVLDYNGNVYIAGSTSSSDFPTTPNAYDNTFAYDGTYNGYGDALYSFR